MSADEAGVSCAACAFSTPVLVGVNRHGEHTPTPILECHRYPPTMLVVGPDDPGGSGLMGIVVQVDSSDWCGEFQPVAD